MRHLIISSLVLALGTAVAFAGANGDALKKSGLAGRWAQNCAAPPRDGNWYDRYEVKRDGTVVETLYKDPRKTSRVSTLFNVRVLASNRVGYSMKEPDGEILELVIHMEGKRHRTWSSRAVRGSTYISDGKLANSGTQTTWFTKCAD